MLGIDGLDFRMLEALVAEGQLPTFARLFERGAAGSLRASDAGLPANSPRIWTSIATGQLPEQHGILDFAHPLRAGELRLMSARNRRSPALWEIASQAGRRIGVVNWWFSAPVEKVDGFLVADRFFEERTAVLARYFGSEPGPMLGSALYPPSLAEPLAALATGSLASPLTPAAAERLDREILRLTAAAVTADGGPLDLLLVYTRALDQLSHMRWKTHAPGVDERFERDDIAAFLALWDGMLAEFMARHVAPEDHFVLLSDHGFARSPGGVDPSGEHTARSTADAASWLLVGPRIRAGARFEAAALVDVLPTLLELAGIPAASDLPGQVLGDVVSGAARQRVAPYGRLARAAPAATAASADAEERARLERLKALGYLQDQRDR